MGIAESERGDMKRVIFESATFAASFVVFCLVALVVALVAFGLEVDSRAVALIAVSAPLLTLVSYHMLVKRREDALIEQITKMLDEMARMRDEHQQEIKRNQTILRNLTTGTRYKVRKEITGRFIYFIADKSRGAVKIGISHDPAQRLAQLQTSTAATLELLAVTEGTEKDEQKLHDFFKADRLTGEWFKFTDELSAFIESVKQADTE